MEQEIPLPLSLFLSLSVSNSVQAPLSKLIKRKQFPPIKFNERGKEKLDEQKQKPPNCNCRYIINMSLIHNN
jgi:hypothetical protein